MLSSAGCESPTGDSPSPVEFDGGALEESATVESAVGPAVAASQDSRLGPTVFWEDGEGGVYESGYRIDEGDVIVEDDIDLGPIDEVLGQHEQLRRGVHDKAFLTAKSFRRWDNPVIRWRFLGGNKTPSAAQQQIVRDAIDQWNSVSAETGLQFVYDPGLSRRAHGVAIGLDRDAGDCHSQFGQHARLTNVWLGDRCFEPQIVQHELGHTLGALHEMTRSDRGTSLDVHMAMVRPGFDTRQYRIDDLWSEEVGPFDVDSIMDYQSYNSRLRTWVGRAGSLQFPAHLSRETLSLWRAEFNPASARLDRLVTNPLAPHNAVIRLDASYAHLDQMRVMDVNGDGRDDIVAELGDALVYSDGGSSAWLPVAPGGTPVTALVDEIVCGSFDAHPGNDVLRIRGTQWDLWSSDGTRSSSTQASIVQDAEVLLDGSGVLVVLADGRWGLSATGNVLSPLRMITTSSMSVANLKLLLWAPGDVRAVALINDRLVIAPVDGRSIQRVWTPLFPSRSPPSFNLRRFDFAPDIDRVWFGLVDGDGEIDMLFGREILDDNGSSEPPVEPIFVSNVRNNPSGFESAFTYPARTGLTIDLTRNAVVGRFEGAGRLSLLAYGSIERQELVPGRFIKRLDALALGQRYLSVGPTRLADKYPYNVGDVHPDPLTPTRFTNSSPGARYELRASFSSPSGVSRVEVKLRRLVLPSGGWSTVRSEIRSISAQPAMVTLDEVFVMPASGTYWLTMTPLAPVPASSAEFASWMFDGLSRCGDAFVEDGEQCDDGNALSGDGCAPTCTWEQVCGDGRTVIPEECDDGNFVDGDGCSASCTWDSVCGDGIRQGPEECDDGNNIGFDLCDNQCRIQLE